MPLARTRREWTSLLAISFSVCCFVLSLASADDEDPAKLDNPYLPREGMTAPELREFIDRMQQSPKTIQQQPGFSEALLVAADRILAANPDDALRAFAVLTKLDGLHKPAVYGDEDAQKKLLTLAGESKDNADLLVKQAVQFYLLEARALDANNAKTEELPALLSELKKFMTDEILDTRHLRICSATVKIINRVDDDELAAKSYKEFGELWAGSSNDELAKYGRKIAKGTRKKAPNMLGKPMPIVGTTHDGKKFDIVEHRGKIVLVDFWATWCGPCKAALPELKAIYEEYQDRGFEIVGVSIDTDKEELTATIESEQIIWTNLLDHAADDSDKHPIAEMYGVHAIPTTFLLDHEGKVIAKNLSGEKLVAKLEELLAEKP